MEVVTAADSSTYLSGSLTRACAPSAGVRYAGEPCAGLWERHRNELIDHLSNLWIEEDKPPIDAGTDEYGGE